MIVNIYQSTKEKYDTDGHGYLIRYCDWNKKWSKCHFSDCYIEDSRCWKVILFLRNYYKQKSHLPTEKELSDGVNVDINIIIEIFPYNYQNRDEEWYEYICRIAGIPRNVEDV